MTSLVAGAAVRFWRAGTSAERKAELEHFMDSFWKCYKSGVGEYELHPVLPSVIETVQRHGEALRPLALALSLALPPLHCSRSAKGLPSLRC